jgi:hypothetical protein
MTTELMMKINLQRSSALQTKTKNESTNDRTDSTAISVLSCSVIYKVGASFFFSLPGATVK